MVLVYIICVKAKCDEEEHVDRNVAPGAVARPARVGQRFARPKYGSPAHPAAHTGERRVPRVITTCRKAMLRFSGARVGLGTLPSRPSVCGPQSFAQHLSRHSHAK